MATIKSYSDLQQSRKLAEILPLESADMYYSYYHNPISGTSYYEEYPIFNIPINKNKSLPCWSLSALLSVLPILDNRSPVIPKTFDGKYRVTYHSTAYERAILTSDYDNPIDACVDMIEKLHELNLL